MNPLRLVTLAPGHFHAALVQKKRLPGIDSRCSVFAPDDADLKLHLDRIASFDAGWKVDVRSGPDWLEQFERDPCGDIAILSGRNRPKLDLMRRAVAKGLHILADKPWIVAAEDYEPLLDVLREADRRGVVVGDAMTERHEATSKRQRELILDPAVFGEWQPGSLEEPSLELESVHYLKKIVNGRPLRRPWWWFDSAISGESIADVGTHLADLALWFLSPEQVVDPRRDIEFLAARRWPLMLSREQFFEVTELAEPPSNGLLEYAGNNFVSFRFNGIHVKLTTRWEYDSPGGDAHLSRAQGTRGTVEVRQEPGHQPEVFLNGDPVSSLHARTHHEDHFAMVLDGFLNRVRDPGSWPEWERSIEVAKYWITTQAVALAGSAATGAA